MEKKFEIPELTIVTFCANDIIVTSNEGVPGNSEYDEWGDDD